MIQPLKGSYGACILVILKHMTVNQARQDCMEGIES